MNVFKKVLTDEVGTEAGADAIIKALKSITLENITKRVDIKLDNGVRADIEFGSTLHISLPKIKISDGVEISNKITHYIPDMYKLDFTDIPSHIDGKVVKASNKEVK